MAVTLMHAKSHAGLEQKRAMNAGVGQCSMGLFRFATVPQSISCRPVVNSGLSVTRLGVSGVASMLIAHPIIIQVRVGQG